MTTIRNAFLALLLGLALPRAAAAHSTTYATYSKYEATTSERSVVFVFALDKKAVLQLVERDVTHAPVAPEALADHRVFFSTYLFARFFVSNGGAPCAHPDELGRFFWDERTQRVVAVTKFVCAAPLGELTIRAAVTHDMPTAHELVGDLRHGRALERSFFFGDDLEARISLPALPQTGQPATRAPRPRGKFSYVAMPDRERRYDDLAEAELGVDLTGDGPAHARAGKTLLHFIGQGVLHIFTGYDHVLFIVTLMFAVGSWRRLGLIVTSFTAAHSITLALATLGVVTLPGRVVEPLIAVSVLFVAVDAVARPQASARPLITFGFGLLHGFGLSNVLRELGLSGRELVPALLGFNLGVEVGQLAIVAPLFPAGAPAARAARDVRPRPHRAVRGGGGGGGVLDRGPREGRVRRMRRPALLLAIVALALTPAQAARANGAFPQAGQILLPADCPDALVLGTNFGLVVSEDAGRTWRWACEHGASTAGFLYQQAAPPSRRISPWGSGSWGSPTISAAAGPRWPIPRGSWCGTTSPIRSTRAGC